MRERDVCEDASVLIFPRHAPVAQNHVCQYKEGHSFTFGPYLWNTCVAVLGTGDTQL